jgi:hypothetical protein
LLKLEQAEDRGKAERGLEGLRGQIAALEKRVRELTEDADYAEQRLKIILHDQDKYLRTGRTEVTSKVTDLERERNRRKKKP